MIQCIKAVGHCKRQTSLHNDGTTAKSKRTYSAVFWNYKTPRLIETKKHLLAQTCKLSMASQQTRVVCTVLWGQLSLMDPNGRQAFTEAIALPKPAGHVNRELFCFTALLISITKNCRQDQRSHMVQVIRNVWAFSKDCLATVGISIRCRKMQGGT